MQKTLLTAVVALAITTAAHADVVAQYTFTGSLLTSSDGDTNSMAGDLTFGAGFSSATVSTTLGNTAPGLYIDSTATTGSNQGNAVLANEYYSFTITPTAGTLSLSNLMFDYASASGTSTFPTENFFVRSSRDGFAANITGAVSSNSATFTTANIGLSAATYQGLSTATEFRIYVQDSTNTSGRGAVLDNITLNSVPEPTTYAMLLGGAGMLFIVSRRKARLA